MKPWIWNNLETIPVKINDVTLREWDQAPLTSFVAEEKKLIALMLNELWVHSIETWFASSRADFDNIRGVVEMFQDDKDAPYITSLWRATDIDTDASLKVLGGYKNARIHIFMATSDEHIQEKFWEKWSSQEERREWVLESSIISIKKVKKYKDKKNANLEIEFSPEDATGNALVKATDGRKYLDFEGDDFTFLIRVIREAIQAGATIINTPDTLWNLLSHESEQFFSELIKRTQDLKWMYNFEFSTHIHNDMASATSWAIAWIRGWARQIELTIAGIWERAGNTPLHEVIWTIHNAWHRIVDGAIVMPSKEIQTELVWPVTRFVESVLSLNKSLQTPFIWALSNVDGSGVHTAAKSVYGDTKNKKDFWWLDIEEFFSPRSWATQICKILSQRYWTNINKENKIIKRITQRACREAETVKALYPARIYAMYLEEVIDFQIGKIEINGNRIKIPLSFGWKNIVLEWVWGWENGIIDATINAINGYLWKKSVDVIGIEVKNKPSLRALYEKFETEVSQTSVELTETFRKRAMDIVWKNGNGHGSEQVWVVHMVLDVWGQEVNIRSASHNTDEATVHAIVNGAMSEILKK